MEIGISLDELNADQSVANNPVRKEETKEPFAFDNSSIGIPLDEFIINKTDSPVTVDSVGNEASVVDDRAPTDQEEEDYFYARRGIEDEEDQDLTVQGQKVLKQRLDVAFAAIKEQAAGELDREKEYADKFAFMKQAGGFAGQSKAAIAADKLKEKPEYKNSLERRYKDQLNSTYNELSNILAGKEFEGKSGITDSEEVNTYSNTLRKKIVMTMLDKGFDVTTIGTTLGIAEFAPFTGTALGVTDVPQTLAQARMLSEEGEEGLATLLRVVSGVEIVAGAVGAGFIVKGVARATGLTSKVNRALDAKGTDDLRQGLGSDSSLINDPKASSSSTSETMQKIIDADITSTEATVKAASEVVDTVEGKELSQKVIREFEEANEVNVTDVDTDTGDLVINQQKARDAGRDTANTAMNLQATRSADEAAIISKGESFSGEREFTDSEAFLDVGEDADALLSPILKPEKFNAIVAIAKDFKANNPNSWKDVDEFGNNKTVIDNLFELTVGKNIDENQELADSLGKYGLTFDEYVMTVVSGGSDAGKILNKLSQIKRAGHLDNVDKLKNKALENGQNSIMRGFRRLENIRRGGMVSMIKTAARNLQSATIRAPMEALENVMDTALVRMSEDGVGAGLMSLIDYQGNWKGSLSHLKYMYRDPVLSKKLTDHILDRPEFEKQYTNLFDNVNEYQKATGRGEGGAFDTVVSKIEDVVTFANTPNRIQEYLVRRGAFMGELERLVKREYDIDLLDALKDGKLRDLMANSSTVRPKGKAQFEDLIETSVRRALDVTYAKAPDIKIFRNASNFITRNGLTVVIEFPRFMFNSLELMGQYSAGAFNPALQRIFKLKKGPMDSKDRQNITRNMTGLMAITAAYQYRTSDDAPASYKELNTGNGSVMDTTPQFPLRQMLWIGEAIKQLGPNAKYLPQVQLATLGNTGELQGTYNNWQGSKVDEILETFGGTSMRTGASNVFIDQIGDIISDSGDVKGNDELGKLLGATVGNYLASWGVPIAQVIEVQRISGNRPMTYEDRSGDYELKDFGESFTSNVKRSFSQRYGNLIDPSSIEDMPRREGLFDPEGGKTRVGAVGSGLLGLTRYTGNSESAEYLIRKGFNDWEIGSRDPIKKVRSEANKLMRKNLPTVVNTVRQFETTLRKEYMAMPANSEYKLDNTVDQFVNRRVRPMIKGYMQDLQAHVKLAADGKATFKELATRTFNKMPEEDRVRALDQYELMQSKLPEKDRQPFDIKNGSHLLMLKALDEALGQGDTFN